MGAGALGGMHRQFLVVAQREQGSMAEVECFVDPVDNSHGDDRQEQFGRPRRRAVRDADHGRRHEVACTERSMGQALATGGWSSMNAPRPVSSRGSSTRGTDLPIQPFVVMYAATYEAGHGATRS